MSVEVCGILAFVDQWVLPLWKGRGEGMIHPVLIYCQWVRPFMLPPTVIHMRWWLRHRQTKKSLHEVLGSQGSLRKIVLLEQEDLDEVLKQGSPWVLQNLKSGLITKQLTQ